MSTSRRGLRLLLPLIGLVGAVDACGSSSTSSTPSTQPNRGPVDVLYAGSLVNLMEHDLGAKFTAATGYQFSGFSAGSSELANQVKGQVRQGDIFLSASPTVNSTLEGPANGSWISWYVSFAKAGLVIGYNPHSPFSSQLATKPWYQVITQPNFQLGRTDPVQDPKGKLTVQALNQAAATYHQPALNQIAQSTAGVFPEETLVGRLQSGQLDAGFFYTNEAKEAGIPTTSLGATQVSAEYTITILDRASHEAGAKAFVAYVLGPQGKSIFTAHGLSLVSPSKLTGTSSDVPSTLHALIPGS